MRRTRPLLLRVDIDGEMEQNEAGRTMEDIGILEKGVVVVGGWRFIFELVKEGQNYTNTVC